MEHSAKSNYERFKTNTLNLVPLLRGRIKAEDDGRGEDNIQLRSDLSETGLHACCLRFHPYQVERGSLSS
jgi:hypothetical protein